MAHVDTLKAYEDLTAANLSESQARAILSVIRNTQETGLENLVTKSEFKEEILMLKSEFKEEISLLKTEMGKLEGRVDTKLAHLEGKIERIKSELEGKIESSKNSILKWIIPILAAQIGLTVSILLRTFK
jgi:hypothetical protein